MGQQLGHQCARCGHGCSDVVGDDDDWAAQISHAQLLNAVVDPATGDPLSPSQQRLAVELLARHDAGACGGAAPCENPPCGLHVFASLEAFLRTSPNVPPEGQHDTDVHADEACHSGVQATVPESTPSDIRPPEPQSLVRPRMPDSHWDEPVDCMRPQRKQPLPTQWEEPRAQEPHDYMWRFLPPEAHNDGGALLPDSSETDHHTVVLDAQRRYEQRFGSLERASKLGAILERPLDDDRRAPSESASTAATSESRSSGRGRRSRGTPPQAEASRLDRQTQQDRDNAAQWWTLRGEDGRELAGNDLSSLDFAAPRSTTWRDEARPGDDPYAGLIGDHFGSTDRLVPDRDSAEILADGRLRTERISAALGGRVPGTVFIPPRLPDADAPRNGQSSSGSDPLVSRCSTFSESAASMAELSPRSMASSSGLSGSQSGMRRQLSIIEAADHAKGQIQSAAATRASRSASARTPSRSAGAGSTAEPWLRPLPSASESFASSGPSEAFSNASAVRASALKQSERLVRPIAVKWATSEVPGAARLFFSLKGHAIEARGAAESRAFTNLELPDQRDVCLHVVVVSLPTRGGFLGIGVARRKVPGERRLAPKGTPLGRVDDSLGMVVDAEGNASLEAEDEIVDEHVLSRIAEGSSVLLQWRWSQRSLLFEVDGNEVGEIPEVPEGRYCFAASMSAGSSLSLMGAT